MSPEVERHFAALAGTAGADRDRYWSEHPAPEAVRREVESLLAFDRDSSVALEGRIGTALSDTVGKREDSAGLQCGAWSLGGVIGRGGMGVVYRAERTDGEVTQSAALKLLPAGADDAYARAAFRRERQILAGLAHPGIARLLDAGHLEDGRPFLVMEYVDGKPIDEFARALPVREKLRLFLSVCRAVSHAHANLVVHRDLKPSNILVTPAGETKLLDFGIARILDVAASAVTQEVRLTPDFASPEQVRGEATGTATDVYSLGAVLYWLLTGHKPHRIESRAPGALETAICKEEPVKPGAHDAELRGDLETILTKALRKEPGERYASVETFVGDIQAFLDLRPIRARSDEFGYSAWKFTRRHWVPLCALAMAILGLGAGLIAARRERAVAQARFDQVRELANQLLGVDQDVRLLPGSTKARTRIVNTALEYLGKLAPGASSDAALFHDLAHGYLRVAEIQGVPLGVSLGQADKAEKSLAEAEKFIQPLLGGRKASSAVLQTAADIAHDRMIMAQSARRRADALARAAECVPRLEAVESAGGGDWAFLATRMSNVSLVHQNLGMNKEGIEYARRAVQYARRDAQGSNVPSSLSRLATALTLDGEFEEALTTLGQVRMLARDRQQKPAPWYQLYNLDIHEGTILGGPDSVSLNRPSEAIRRLQAALDRAEEHARADPSDFASHSRVCQAVRQMGPLLTASSPRRALELQDLCILRLSQVKGSNIQATRYLAVSNAQSAEPLRLLGRADEARRRLDKAFVHLKEGGADPAGKFEPFEDAYWVLNARAKHDAATGRPDEAIATYRRLLEVTSKSPNFDPSRDLRHADGMSLLLRDLTLQLRRAGRRPEADELDSRRVRLWESQDRRKPGNAFIQRRLGEARGGTAAK